MKSELFFKVKKRKEKEKKKRYVAHLKKISLTVRCIKKAGRCIRCKSPGLFISGSLLF